SFTGHVVCSGTNVPNAVVMLAMPGGHGGPVASTVADGSGAYAIKVPAASYMLFAAKSGFLGLFTAPVLALGPGTTITTNVSLLPATNTIAGRFVDAAQPSLGIPGHLVVAQTSDKSLLGISVTDAAGNYTLGVVAGQWRVSTDSEQSPSYGYLDLQNNTTVDTTTGSVAGVTVAVPKGTALFYGSVKDDQNHPLPGFKIYADDNLNQFEGTGLTDANGNYVAVAKAGTWWVNLSSSSPGYTNYTFSQGIYTNISDGQAVRADFVGIFSPNHLSGYLRDAATGQGIPNVGVNAWPAANPSGFNAHADTDGNGFYVMAVANGSWTVSVNCGDCGDCLSSSRYLCPDRQTAILSNANGVADFFARQPTAQITGYVRDTSNNPVGNVGVYAYANANFGNNPSATTDSTGHYQFSLANGTWNVGLFCCGNNAVNPLGYLCVGEQVTTVSNSTNVVSFSLLPARYQITGHLRDASNNPIPNVWVNAGNGSYSACSGTDATGFYTLHVANGDWNINLDCNGLALLGYLCPGGQNVLISGANGTADFRTDQAPYQLTGWVKDNNNQPFTNLNVHAYATIGTNFYWLNSWTDGSGNYSLPVANGQWNVGVDCGGLGSGYLCPNDVPVEIAGASTVMDVTIQACGSLQVLTTSLPAGQVGSYYEFDLQASSCNPGFYWSPADDSGPLPAGLQLDSNGEIYGTPDATGTFDFTVQVTDGSSTTINQSLSLVITAALPDVLVYYLMKMESFTQQAANLAPDPSHGPFAAIVGLVQSSWDAVPIANLDLPSGAFKAFPPGTSGPQLEFHEGFPSQAALDAAYTNGNYTFAMATVHNGFQFPVLTLPPAAYPAAPSVNNFAAAQAINPLSPFTLQWSNPADASTSDTIWVSITDGSGMTVFSTPSPATHSSTCLRGNATSVVVPPNTFQSGAAYTGAITFYRATSVNTTAYPGALGVTLIGTRTRFSLAAPAGAPVLSQPVKISATQFGFLLSGLPGQTYTILTSTNLASPLSEWSPVLTTNLSDSPAFIQDNQAAGPWRFYRAKVGP
ncbi:MAG: putative Ig domain-containing protein, partial [Verrucomicrobia bacterium]|nr:putative Ig domain-containing protein [Verrucomicrobiota bacterium]